MTVGSNKSINIKMADKSFKIMVVEDEPLLLRAIGKKLELENIEGILCETGEKALNLLKTHDSPPDVIWLDYYLSDMDGISFMLKLKEQNKEREIPVIVISNSASQEKIKGMLALGAKKYLLKAEYRLDEIIDIIKDFLK